MNRSSMFWRGSTEFANLDLEILAVTLHGELWSK